MLLLYIKIKLLNESQYLSTFNLIMYLIYIYILFILIIYNIKNFITLMSI